MYDKVNNRYVLENPETANPKLNPSATTDINGTNPVNIKPPEQTPPEVVISDSHGTQKPKPDIGNTGSSPDPDVVPPARSCRTGLGKEGVDLTTPEAREASAIGSGFAEDDLPRLNYLAKDPDKPAITPGTWMEAEVGLGLEKEGAVEGLIRSPHSGAEFVDASGQWWDVKAFRDFSFNLSKAMDKVAAEMRAGNNLMLDTRYLTADQLSALEQAIAEAGWSDRVLWWP